jgi:hypothetical protein
MLATIGVVLSSWSSGGVENPNKSPDDAMVCPSDKKYF